MLVSRRSFLAAGAGSAVAIAQAPAAKPNLLFVFADDMGWSDVGFNGRKEWQTPNLDRLASQGTTFDRWYTACPLCAPSRAALMTGKYGIHNTVRSNVIDLPTTEVTIAEAVRAQGYTTALIGKWHKGANAFTHPLEQGFDTTFGYLDARHAWEHFPKTLFRGRDEVPVQGYSSDILADEAIAFFRKQDRSRPFYLHLAFIEPHFLVEAPDEDVKVYEGKFAEKDRSQPYNARYAAMIHRFDKSVGRVLKALDDLGMASNTIVVFTSDNGATFESGNKGASWFHDSNRPYRGQKRSLEEGGIRVPGIVRWPGKVPAGKRSAETLVSNIDILPTFLAAAGGKPDPAWKVDGVNMLDEWTGKTATPPDRTLFWEFQIENADMQAAMRGDFKLLQAGANFTLYNVRTDPQERRPIQAEYPEIFNRLKQELKDWMSTAVPAPAKP